MIRQLSRSIREYKMYAILAPLMMVGEVAMEVLIPTLMAGFMDSGVKTSDMSFVLRQGGGLLLCAMASLCFGILSATFASRAAAGFAKNLRQDIFCGESGKTLAPTKAGMQGFARYIVRYCAALPAEQAAAACLMEKT